MADRPSAAQAVAEQELVDAAATMKLTEGANLPSDEEREQEQEEENDDAAAEGAETIKAGKKRKKRKAKSKKPIVIPYLGRIPEEVPPPPPESAEETERWNASFKRGVQTYNLPAWGLLAERNRSTLETFLTPSCRQFQLVTPRLRLRQVALGDTTGIRRIKMEPTVQRTQLYGSPSVSDIKDSFQNRYIRSSIPRSVAHGISQGAFRDEYVFALTALDPAKIVVRPPGEIRIANRLSTAEGYLGNIALHLEYSSPLPALSPKKGKILTQPTFGDMTQAGLIGKMFYEIHPQLWGQGLMSEAFAEVLRFAMEEVGCTRVISDPTTINEASIRLCLKNGLRYTRTVNDNAYGRPQLFHEITREEWWKVNRPNTAISDRWGGKEVCRWCFNFHIAPPTLVCSCGWAKYCSRECQRADWLFTSGHQTECDGNQ